MNNKNIIIAGVIAVGLYLFSHTKKIIPMTLTQKAAWHDQITHRMAHMSTAEKIRALKMARKEKAAAEGTPEQKIRLTPMERMLALRAKAEEKILEEQKIKEMTENKVSDLEKEEIEILKRIRTTTQIHQNCIYIY